MQLRPYQVAGRDFLASRRFALLGDSMRLGKSPQAVTAAKAVGAESLLVVCPAIAVPHWRRELVRWWPDAALSRVAVLSYDRLRSDPWPLKEQWDVAVVDECHYAKNPAAQRTKLVYGKGGIGWQAKHLWALSGTPMPNHPGELWPMLKAFGVVGLSYDDYVRRYCTINTLTLRPTGTRTAMVPELRALLAKVMLRRTRKEVAPDMPDVSFEFLEMDIDADLDLDTDGRTDDDLLHNVEHCVDREDRVALAMAKAKVLADEIEFAIKNDILRQTVVFAWHVDPIQWLTRELIRRGIVAAEIIGASSSAAREHVQREFAAGRCQVMCGNLLAAGTAVSFAAADHGYFLELSWTGAENLQAANRLVSMEKATPVTFDVCSAPGSIDERVQRVLLRKMNGLRAAGLA